MENPLFLREFTIDSRFIGPDGVVNGGHLGGVFERELGSPLEVTLRRPTPPDKPLSLYAPDPHSRELRDGELALAFARRAEPDIAAPEPVPFALASEVGGARADVGGHPFPRCFVCGPERAQGDGLRLFSGTVEPGRVAAPLVFTAAFAGDDGAVLREHVTAALDCPGGFAIWSADDGHKVPILLASFGVRILAPVAAGERCVAVGLAGPAEGRKRPAMTALYGEDGTLRAAARALWVVVA